jgi:hypothetical protein
MVSNNHIESFAPGQLREVRQSLLHLHKALLESEREIYERRHGRIETNYRFLELLMHDPWFDWLHRLSELIVQIDEMLDAEEPPGKRSVDGVIDQAKGLLAPAEDGSGEFQRKYFAALQESPEVVLAHGEVVKILDKNSGMPD